MDKNTLHALLRKMVETDASDLFLTVGAPPHIKVQGESWPLSVPPLQSGQAQALAYSIMSAQQIADFERQLEANLSYTAPDIGRFRVSVYRQRGETAMVARLIHATIPDFESLGLPPVVQDLALLRRGLLLVVGAAGSGKSTTLASMIDHRARNSQGHILTIEDPIEYLFTHDRCTVDQREVGIDTHSFADALRNAMRQAPDIIMIGEIRDRETMEHAIAYAETGHLCVSTLHAANASQALKRIINFFPENLHPQLRMDLSLNLQAVISQRLLPGRDSKRVLATELLRITCAAMSSERRRSAGSNTSLTSMNSSACVISARRARPARTVSGPPITAAARKSAIAARSCGISPAMKSSTGGCRRCRLPVRMPSTRW
jgi:twitching motility protein PilU